MALFAESADVSVRPAVAGDEVTITEIQLAAWRSGHADVLGADALDSLDASAFRARWATAIVRPPGAAYRVLVACEGATVVGFAAVRPLPADESTPGALPGGELLALEVATAAQRTGHGSRLLAAAVDLLRQDGVNYLVAWVLDGDAARAQFLQASGLGPDNTVRELATGPTPDRTVSEHRWSAELLGSAVNSAGSSAGAVQPRGRPQGLASAFAIPGGVVGEREPVPRGPVSPVRLGLDPRSLEGDPGRGSVDPPAGRARQVVHRQRAGRFELVGHPLHLDRQPPLPGDEPHREQWQDQERRP